MDNPERTLLSWKAARFITKNSVVSMGYGNCDSIEEFSSAGFAYYYLRKCLDRNKSMDMSDVTLYKQLFEFDAKLGITQSEQLYACLFRTLQMDVIEV